MIPNQSSKLTDVPQATGHIHLLAALNYLMAAIIGRAAGPLCNNVYLRLAGYGY